MPGKDVPWFMWKTGTSAARRDAWAVGHNRRYAVGVWVGRFYGTGRAAFVGAEAAEPLLAQLFNLTILRADGDPPPPVPTVVQRPLPPPPELADSLRITAPANGQTFIAIGGKAVLYPESNRKGGQVWFLNGRLLDDRRRARLVLPDGRYELRCIGPAGQSAGVRFVVRRDRTDHS